MELSREANQCAKAIVRQIEEETGADLKVDLCVRITACVQEAMNSVNAPASFEKSAPAAEFFAGPAPLYAERDTEDLGEYYLRHVDAMTREDLHSKAAIAAELAVRDRRINQLRVFAAKVSGSCMGLAISGSNHPAPDTVLMELFEEGQRLSQNHG